VHPIRINGRDIAAETLESHCDSCTNLCGCDEGTSCRVWRYQGQEYAEAPVGLVAEAILRETYGGTNRTVSDPVAYEGVLEKLRRFFTGKSVEETVTASSCCTPGEQEVCCEASAKSSCCGTAEVGTCGCQRGAGLP